MIEQTIIAISGMGAVWLSQDGRDSHRKWACIIGLIAQPFWLHVTWAAEQWGMFVLTFVYVAAWIRGLRTYWMAV